MSCDHFDPNCRGCMPAIIDATTGEVLPDDHPTMQRLTRAFRAAPRAQQEAFWRVTMKNSRDPDDLRLCEPLIATAGAACSNEKN